MAYQSKTFKITGIAPLLMHSGQLADPLNKFSKAIKEISGKRGKTESDMEEMAKLEWQGSLYLGDEGIVLPAEVILACFINAAKKKKLGQQAKAGVYCDQHATLEYPGKNGKCDLEAMWKDEKFRFVCPVTVQRARVMRTRPHFKDWSATFSLTFNPAVLNGSVLLEILRISGEQVGVGDWRPRFGRFTVEEVN